MRPEYRKERSIRSADDIVFISNDQGDNWFTDDVMGFFSTRISDKIYTGRFSFDDPDDELITHDVPAHYFVTSELFGQGRFWTVRVAFWWCDVFLIENVSSFGEFRSRTSAHRKAAKYATVDA